MLPVVLALGAAALYACASVLQHRAASSEPARPTVSLGLLARLARRPLWVLGVGADVAAFGLQFAALAEGTLVLVQPLLVVGLLFALPLGARLSGRRVRRADVAAAGAVCAGLAAFLTVADPAPGRATAASAVWLALISVGCGTALLLALAAQQRAGRGRALLLSASAGVVYGLAAALTKTTGQLLSRSPLGAFAHWEPYALVAVGVAGMVVAASAFQAGALDVSLPAMSVLDPVVSVLVGALAFGESMAATPTALAAETAGLALTVAGVVSLARAPAVRALHEPRPA